VRSIQRIGGLNADFNNLSDLQRGANGPPSNYSQLKTAATRKLLPLVTRLHCQWYQEISFIIAMIFAWIYVPV
jgi:hypothetical protein